MCAFQILVYLFFHFLRVLFNEDNFKIFFFLMELGVKLTALCLQADALSLEPCLQSILLWLFWRWGLQNYLPGLALNLGQPSK
jgi:cellulose synthase/poly-beta-1,6-N-acetylglucosamine synthase-like glycosyltransferase